MLETAASPQFERDLDWHKHVAVGQRRSLRPKSILWVWATYREQTEAERPTPAKQCT